jgi:hypothetical protein
MQRAYSRKLVKKGGGIGAALGVIGLVSFGQPVLAQQATLAEAISGGKVGLDLRYRYEHVDADNFERNANASTLRTRLNYTTGSFNGFTALIELDDITALGSRRYNEFTGLPRDKTEYPVVADPTGTEVNQAYLSYAGLMDTTIRLGRQRIVYDNARFIGNVGWRQNEQTFDGFAVSNTALPHMTLNYAYIDQVNRIFGKDSPKGEVDMRSHLLNASYSGLGFGTLTGYGYFLEYVDAPATSNRTVGIRLAGTPVVAEGMKLLYALEYARQDDYRRGASTIDADYQLIELGAEMSGVSARLGQEVLGADGSAFSTPLATGHAFNGWADIFLNTPVNGLQDRYLKLSGAAMGTTLQAAYHRFDADRGSADYGSEINLMASRPFGKVNLMAKYARYSADELAVDTEKVWLMAQVAF